MAISSEMMHDTVLNFSVSSASIEDIAALAVNAFEKLNPRRFIIGVDPWMFNASFVSSRWESISADYGRAARILSIEETIAHSQTPKYLQLVNYEYTRQSLLSIFGRRHSAPKFYFKADQIALDNSDLLRADGSRIYNTNYANQPPDATASAAQKFVVSKDNGFSDFQFSKAKMQSFLKMMDFLENRADVTIFLAPFHPAAYVSLMQSTPQIAEVELTLKSKFQNNHKIDVVGSFDPRIAHCQSEDFLDGMHSRPVCISKILSVAQ